MSGFCRAISGNLNISYNFHFIGTVALALARGNCQWEVPFLGWGSVPDQRYGAHGFG